MKGLVISWFYPPSTSAEGLVTFKLLKNSHFEYDVISAKSRQWSYAADTALTSKNIKVYTVEAESLNLFVKKGTELALELCEKNHYDFIMTRAMPPQSHEIGLKIKQDKRVSNIPWLASMADPIARNPYDFDRYFNLKPADILKKLPLTLARVFIYERNKWFEKKVTEKAGLLIYPSEEQCRFSAGSFYEKLSQKSLIIPHNFDRDIIPPKVELDKSDDKIIISHLGHLNRQRNAVALIKALAELKAENPQMINRLQIRFVGNIPHDQQNLIQVLHLEDVIQVQEPVDYFESLRIMNESDYLLLIDAKFSFLEKNIFFASKLADYMGADKPIIGLTMQEGPSARIIKGAGYPVCDPDDVRAIKNILIKAATNRIGIVKEGIFKEYESKNVAAMFDKKVKELIRR